MGFTEMHHMLKYLFINGKKLRRWKFKKCPDIAEFTLVYSLHCPKLQYALYDIHCTIYSHVKKQVHSMEMVGFVDMFGQTFDLLRNSVY